MAPSIPTTEPDLLFAGDTCKWTKTISDYPSSDGWTLVYSFRGPSAFTDVTAATSGSGYAVTIPLATTTPLQAGGYTWSARVTKAGETYTVGRGVLNVELAAGASLVPHEVKMLAAIEAVLEGRITADVQQYAIGGRQITKIPIEELAKLRGRYQAKVERLKHPGSLGIPVQVAFSPADGAIGNAAPVVLPPWYHYGG